MSEYGIIITINFIETVEVFVRYPGVVTHSLHFGCCPGRVSNDFCQKEEWKERKCLLPGVPKRLLSLMRR